MRVAAQRNQLSPQLIDPFNDVEYNVLVTRRTRRVHLWTGVSMMRCDS